jgi:hypothetical protein
MPIELMAFEQAPQEQILIEQMLLTKASEPNIFGTKNRDRKTLLS